MLYAQEKAAGMVLLKIKDSTGSSTLWPLALPLWRLEDVGDHPVGDMPAVLLPARSVLGPALLLVTERSGKYSRARGRPSSNNSDDIRIILEGLATFNLHRMTARKTVNQGPEKTARCMKLAFSYFIEILPGMEKILAKFHEIRLRHCGPS